MPISKRELKTVTEEEWATIPDCQEHLKNKVRKRNNVFAMPEHVLAGTTGLNSKGNGLNTPMMSGAATPMMMAAGGGG